MKKTFLLLLIVSLSGVGVTALSWMDVETYNSLQQRAVPLSTAIDTIPKDRTGDFITDPGRRNPYDLKDPQIIEKDVEYDPVTNQYIIRERIGSDFYRAPTYMTFEEYMEWRAAKQEREYFARMAGIGTGSAGLKRDPIGRVDVNRSLVDRLFGGSTVDIKPQGNIDVILGVNYQKVENPILLQRQQQNTIFNFDMAINMNVTGKIGEKLKLNANYNTQATFDFDNQMRLEYDSEAFSEDEIIKKIEAGNVSLPLKSTLIQGAQALFGIKTELQFGKLRVTAIASQQRSQAKNIVVQGGTQQQFFAVRADEYDENRHFFLSHFNRETFEYALDKLPQIQSVFKVNRIDVYVTNERNMPEGVRDIVAISDLGELIRLSNPGNVQPGPGAGNVGIPQPGVPPLPLPANDVNTIFQDLLNNPSSRFLNEAVNVLQSPPFNMQQSRDFEKLRARKLTPSEFTVNQELGFISLNTALRPDQVLGVAYEYVYNGKTYQVGEFDNEVPGALNDTLGVIFVRMLKSTTPRVDIPNWHLMMKNFYNINAYQVSPEDFRLDIFYEDPGGGEKRFLPTSNIASEPLIRVFNMDNLNPNGDPGPDGVFDFVPGLTINPRNGRIMFPVLEPFGSSLSTQITEAVQRERYVYQMLYDSTITRAREYQELNRFVIRGSYKSSISSEISLGAFNIPEGSVRVTGGAIPLVEGVHYEIDYGLGRVRILDPALLEPGNRVSVSFEDNALFSFQQKTMLGLRAEYEVSKNLNIGGTYLHLFERPFTQKVNLGDDPINNRIFGLDVNYSEEAPWLTRLVDKLPFYSTKEASKITFAAEGAYLKPGHSRAINQDGAGAIYLDDFEGVISRIDLRTPANQWVLSSVPQNAQRDGAPVYTESALIDNRLGGVNRALLNWYRIDNAVRNDNDNLNPYTKPIELKEIFRNASLQPGLNNVVQVFDLTYHPRDRGPYNYDIPGGTQYSAGLDSDGSLLNPSSRWAGIQRPLTTNDFEAANIEYVEMWVLNPFMQRGPDDNLPVTGPGRLVLNIGNVSEDILRDSRLFFENGVPVPTPDGMARADVTNWGLIPRSAQIVPAFDIDETNRRIQDVGLDGMDDNAEREFLVDYLSNINGSSLLSPDAKNRISADPANDNFAHFRDEIYSDQDGIVVKHKKFNNPEGNSPSSQESGASQFPLSYTNIPDSEDINRDNTLNETEAYYEYIIPFERDVNGGVVINEFITDTVNAPNSGTWYRIKVPISQFNRAVNNIQDFRSMRFIRLYLDGFDESVTFRFARFELVRNQWRRYLRDLKEPGVVFPGDPDDDIYFDLAAVNFDENSGKLPFNYIIPPGINRERSIGAFPDIFQNEQSLAYNVCDLPDGRAVAAYRILNYDMRLFERIKMFIHASYSDSLPPIADGKVSLFMRLGSDFTSNYYEYEIPLSMSDPMLGLRDPANIWKVENNMDFSLEVMKQLKLDRNNIGFALTEVYENQDPENPNNKIKVIGNPNFGLVKGIMIGVKNIGNDNQARCFEVWVNELRVNGFDERGGLAALARLNMQLADLGNIGVAGNYSTIGWGGLDQRLAQRSREDVIQYDITANLELGKFFNEKTGIRIPFYAQYSNTYRLPQFDPYDLDIELNEKINNTPDQSDRDSIRNQAIDFLSIKTYSFTNVRKERVQQTTKAPMPWNIENFSLTYSYAETFRRDPIIEFDNLEQYRFGLDYSFARKVTYIQPFKNLIKKDKYFKLITDFNFNPLPNSFSVSNVFDRQYQQRRFRFSDPQYDLWVNKRFLWDRNYNLQWDLTRSLKINYSALANAIIDEIPEIDEDGQYNEDFNRERNRQEILKNIRNLGRLKNFSHNINATYTVPTKNIPFLDFVNIRATVTATYTWNRAALQQEFLGNVIQNSQTRNLSGDFNFDRLYQKSKYLTSIEKAKAPVRGGAGARGQGGGAVDQKEKDTNLPNRPGGKEPTPVPAEDEKKKREAKTGPGEFERILIRPLLLIRKARLNYTQNFASIVPGFTPTPFLFGLAENWTAPGWQYIAGLQPTNAMLDGYAQNRWITDAIFLNQQVYRNTTETFDARVTLEPFNGFKIDLDINKSNTFNNTLFLKDTLDDGMYDVKRLNSRDLGSFTISYLAINTLFNNDVNGMFRNFENTRPGISTRVRNEMGLPPGEHALDGSDYELGLGRFQTDVLIPSFLAAYTNTPVDKVQLDVFKTAPKPNWTLSYDGLTRIPAVKEIFSSVRISHAYKSTLTINAFNSSAKYTDQFEVINDITANYYSRFEIPNIVINESMSPLLGIDVKTNNDIIIKADLRKNRNLAMSFIDFQLSETRSSEYIVGFGYEIKNFVINFLSGNKNVRQRRNRADTPPATPPAGGSRGGQARSANNLRINCDFSIRDDLTVIHLLDQEQPPIPTRGLRTTRFSPNVEYDVSKSLTVRLFVDYSRTVPATTQSFPITNINTGVRVRFSLN